MSVFVMKRVALIVAVLLLQLSYLPLVAQASQASPEEKAVGKAAGFYHHLAMARSSFKKAAPVETAAASIKAPPQPQVVLPQTQPEPVKANPVEPNKYPGGLK